MEDALMLRLGEDLDRMNIDDLRLLRMAVNEKITLVAGEYIDIKDYIIRDMGHLTGRDLGHIYKVTRALITGNKEFINMRTNAVLREINQRKEDEKTLLKPAV